MSDNLVDGEVYVAPNGYDMVKIYPHGFIEPVSEIPQERGEIIQEMSAVAISKLGEDVPATKIFQVMGWKPITEITTIEEKLKAIAYDFFVDDQKQFKNPEDAYAVLLDDYKSGNVSESFLESCWQTRISPNTALS